jgi:hypothetical protein
MAPQLLTAGVFPADMVNGAVINNAWNNGAAASTVTVRSSTSVTAGDAFTVSFTSLPSDACVKMMVSNANIPGLIGIDNTANGAGTSTAPVNVGISAVTAAGLCGTAGNTNRASIRLLLKG